jgi:hypothetical protein
MGHEYVAGARCLTARALEISGTSGKLVWIVFVVADREHFHRVTSRVGIIDHPLDRRAPASIREPAGVGKDKVQDSFAC